MFSKIILGGNSNFGANSNSKKGKFPPLGEEFHPLKLTSGAPFLPAKPVL